MGQSPPTSDPVLGNLLRGYNSPGMLNNSADKPEAVLEIWLQHCLALVAHYSWMNVAHAQLIHGWLKIMIGVVPPFSSFFLQVQSLLYENTSKGPKYSHRLFLWTVHRPSCGVSSLFWVRVGRYRKGPSQDIWLPGGWVSCWSSTPAPALTCAQVTVRWSSEEKQRSRSVHVTLCRISGRRLVFRVQRHLSVDFLYLTLTKEK